MKFHILTLFPEMIENGLSTSIVGRAREKGQILVDAVNIRDFSQDKHKKTDDYTYGGGAGLLMQAQPVYDAWKSVEEKKSCPKRLRTIYATPKGALFTQSMAEELAREDEVVILCGHYEGIDERVLEEIVTDYVSIGDYVLTGGELAAMVMVDAVARLVPGVLHNENSAETESFHRHLLEYPQYSRPEVWRGKKVPEVLLEGDHKKIAGWRLEQSLALTKERRPDLYARYREEENVIASLSRCKRHNIPMIESLSRGRGEILYNEAGNLLIQDRSSYLCSAAGEESGLKMAALWEEAEEVLAFQKFLADMLEEKTDLRAVQEYRPACYTQKNPLRVTHKDIRRLGPDELSYAEAHWENCGAKERAFSLQDCTLYGAYAQERLVGFGGWYADGSLGPLFVEESFRGRKIGASLEAFCVNRQLEAGYVPYGLIPAENEAAMGLQEHLGLYLASESVWLLRREKP